MISMNDGYSVIIPFQEWDSEQDRKFKKAGGKSVGVIADPLYIGRFMNWLERTPEGKEYVRQLAVHHKLLGENEIQ